VRWTAGDNKATAEAICRMIGVFDDNENLSEHSFTGRQFSSAMHAYLPPA
jgi:magnesium-transporting ATPase (P-type)